MATRELLRAKNGRFRRVTLGDVFDRLFVSGPVAPERWGPDHRSTLLYVDTRIVDHHGLLHANRRDSPAGPMGCDPHMRITGEYPTRLENPKAEVRGHTDYDCLVDAIAAGYLTIRLRPEDVRVRYSSRWWHGQPGEDPVLPDEPVGDDLIEMGNAVQYVWTDKGYEMIARLRRWRSEGSSEGFSWG